MIDFNTAEVHTFLDRCASRVRPSSAWRAWQMAGYRAAILKPNAKMDALADKYAFDSSWRPTEVKRAYVEGHRAAGMIRNAQTLCDHISGGNVEQYSEGSSQ